MGKNSNFPGFKAREIPHFVRFTENVLRERNDRQSVKTGPTHKSKGALFRCAWWRCSSTVGAAFTEPAPFLG